MIKKTVDKELTEKVVGLISKSGILENEAESIPYICMSKLKNHSYQNLVDISCKYKRNIYTATLISLILSNEIEPGINGILYIAHNYNPDTKFDFYVKVKNNRYFNIQQGICYEISDDDVFSDPDFYKWFDYKRYFPYKAEAVEKLHVFYSDELMEIEA